MIGGEEERLREVARFLKLDFNKSSEFQDIVELAAQLCDKPVALITLLDEASNWMVVRSGTDIPVMPRETSFCQFGIQQDDLFIIPDATKDDRFANNPLVHTNPNLKFYAGAPLMLQNGLKLGMLCLFDLKPNSLTEVQEKVLPILARQVTFLMELEMGHTLLQQKVEEIEGKNESLLKIAQLQSHQIRQPLTTIMGLVDLVAAGYQDLDEEWMEMFRTATGNFDKTIHDIVAESLSSKDLRAIRFNKMVEEIEDYAILLLDDVGTIENWNKGAERIKGYKASEIIGRNFSTFYTNEDKMDNRPGKLISESASTGVARDEGWRVRKDGTMFWARVIITAVHDEKGAVIGFTKVTRDLTSIKEAQDAQMVSADMYELILERTNRLAYVGGWELDIINNTLSWTSITKQIHGVDEDYIPQLDEAINFYKPGSTRKKIAHAVKQAIEEGIPWDLELQIITRQGKEVWVHTTGRSNHRDGVCTKVYGTFQDVNAGRQESLNLLHDKLLCDDLLNAASDVSIIATDTSGIIRVFNSGAEKLLGYSTDEVISKHNPSLFHAPDELMHRGQELSEEIGSAAEGFNVLVHKAHTAPARPALWTYIKKDGTRADVSLIATPIRENDTTVKGYLFIGTALP